MTLKYKTVKHKTIKSYRKLYLENLPELQELFIEWIVEKSNFYTINNAGKAIGYFIVSKQNSLVEFFVDTQYINEAAGIFENIYSKFNIENVLCKSFDALLLKCCCNGKMKYKVVGHLFRDYIDTAPQDITEFTKIELADESDYDDFVKHDNELYETKEDLRFFLKNRYALKYYIEDKLIGCGFLIKVNEFYNHCDIGMWVDTPYRNKGYATKIISDLKQRCIKDGVTVTCGCAADNIASRKVLEKNGFRTKHDLLMFGKTEESIQELTDFVKENI
ncbi:MAG: GNAT family N-acetyltransferase [Lentimicrobiaceae bacterium]|nr:GNAT family N-acetyltransferase [Lentimicrobiaceae bacterium]